MLSLEDSLDVALRARDYEEIVWLIDAGADVNYATTGGETALLHAAGDGLSHVVQVLLAHGADPNYCGNNGLTPLLKACGFGHHVVCQLLLDNGANLFVQDSKGRNCVQWAKFSQDKATIQTIAVKFSELELKRQEIAQEIASADVELRLVQRNDMMCDSINQILRGSRDDKQLLALLDSTEHVVPCKSRWKDALNKVESITSSQRTLSLGGSTVGSREDREWKSKHSTLHFTEVCHVGWTPILLASYHGNLRLSRLLTWYGADVDRETLLGHTAVTWASYCGQLDIIKFLVGKARASARRPTNKENKTALIHACRGGKQAVVRYLVQFEWSQTLLEAERAPSRSVDPYRASSKWGENCLMIDQPHVQVDQLTHTEEDEIHENIEGNIYVNGEGFDEPKEDLSMLYGNQEEKMKIGPSTPKSSCNKKQTRAEKRRLLKQLDNESKTAQMLLVAYSEYKSFLNFSDNDGFNASYYATEMNCTQSLRWIEAAVNRVSESIKGVVELQARNAPLECPNHCGVAVRTGDMDLHLKWSCSQRLVPCPVGCEAKVKACNVTQHRDRLCSERVVRCGNVGEGCMITLKESVRELHEAHKCTKRKVACRLGCGNSVVFDQLLAHEMETCRLRVIECSLGCGYVATHESLRSHLRYACPDRPVPCDLGCGKYLKWRELENHRKSCKTACKWHTEGCNATFAKDEKRSIHELHLCPFRYIECSNGCGIQKLQQQCKEEHEANCSHRTVECPLGCGETMQAFQVDGHIIGEMGKCPLRRLPCRREYAGKRVKILKIELDELVRQQNDDSTTTLDNIYSGSNKLGCESSLEHVDVCGQQTEALEIISGETSRFGNPSKVQSDKCGSTTNPSTCSYDSITDVRTDDEHGCDSDNQTNNNKHRYVSDNEVGVISDIGCIGKQDDVVFTSGSCSVSNNKVDEGSLNEKVQTNHESGSDPNNKLARNNEIESTSNEKAKRREEDSGHPANNDATVEPTTQNSDGVAKNVHLDKHNADGKTLDDASHIVTILEWHPERNTHSLRYQKHVLEASLETFTYVKLLDDVSTLSCGLTEASKREKHETDHCSLRLVTCPLSCDQMLHIAAIEKHVDANCPNRVSSCALGCGFRAPHNQLWAHEEADCAKRMIQCECGTNIIKEFVTDHAKTTCPLTQVRCTLGCGVYLERSRLKEHEENDCPKRVVACSNGCGIQMLWACELDEHLASKCELRKVECELCGAIEVFEELDVHKATVCPKRLLRCSRGCSAPPMHADQIEFHQSTLCEEIPRPCSLGCNQTVTDTTQENHESECVYRLAKCRFNCGEQVKWCNLEDHTSNRCQLRPVECPEGCGESSPFNTLSSHLLVCSRRVVPCGAEVPGCSRMIQSWLAGDTRNGKGRCFKCKAHNETILGYAAKSGDVALVQHILNLTDHLKAMKHESNIGQTALTLAAEHGHVEVVRLLIRAGADPNQETRRSRTPLTCAIYGRHQNVVELLLQCHARASHVPGNRLGALQVAKAMGNGEILYIIQNAVDLEVNQRKLFIEISRGRLDKIRELLKSGGAHFPRRLEILSQDCSKARKHLNVVNKELKALKEAKIPAEKLVEVSKAEYDLRLSESNELMNQIQAIRAECERLNNKVLAPIVESAKRAILSIKRRDMQQTILNVSPSTFFRRLVEAVVVLLDLENKGLAGVLSPTRTIASSSEKDEDHIDFRIDHMRRYQIGVQFLRNPKALGTLERTLRTNSVSKHQLHHFVDVYLKDPDFVNEFTHHIEEGKRIESELAAVRFDHDTDSDSQGQSSDEENSRGSESLLVTISRALCQCVHAIHQTDDIAERIKPLKLDESKVNVLYNRKQVDLASAQNLLKSKLFSLSTVTNTEEEAMQEYQSESDRLKRLEESIHTARLLLHVDSGGHSALSWAAMYGDTRVISLLLDKGACAGYDEAQLSLAAKIIQRAWRTRVATWLAHAPGPDALERRVAALACRARLKDSISSFRHERRRTRCPLATALFNGYVQCAKLLLKRGAVVTRSTLCMPSAPPPHPFPSMNNEWNLSLPAGAPPIHDSQDPINSFRAASFGVEYMTAKTWKHGTGWDDEDRHSEALALADTQEHQLHARRMDRLKAKESHLKVEREKSRQREVHELLEVAIMEGDFKRVFEALDLGANVDYTATSGHTALSFAAFRAATMLDDEGNEVLVVDAMMQRATSRPNVNRECKLRQTPLTLAASNGHVDVMDALIRNGADVHRTTSSGMNALMHAVKSGKHDATRYLLELGADVDCRNNDGMTAIQIAAQANFLDIMKSLSQRRHGNCGVARVSRGAVEVFTCAHGCGTKGTKEELKTHEPSCSHRVVDCPLGCGCHDLWYRELEEHTTNECVCRQVECPKGCDVMPKFNDIDNHVANHCIKRFVTCELCESQVVLEQLDDHTEESCPERYCACSLCSEQVKSKDMKHHQENECLKRAFRCTCGATMLAGDHPDHMERACPDRLVPCRWECEAGVQAKFKMRHELAECPSRPIPCPASCGRQIAAGSAARHMMYECDMRFVACKNKCGMKVLERKMADHLTNECSQRMVQCEHGCGETYIAHQLEKHYKVCRFYPLGCGNGCGETVRRYELAEHKVSFCRERMVQCRTGCPKKMREHERERHETWECRKRQVYCRQGCDAIVASDKLNRHHKRECKMRFVPCPSGCGHQLRFMDLEIHKSQECIRR